MKKKTFIILFLLSTFVIVGLCGCTSNKQDVKLKSKKEILKYASEKFGKANYISDISKSDLIEYTLQDNQYKFYYTCSSSVSDFCIDGSCPQIYYETTNCAFEKNYRDYILGTLNLDNIYDELYKNYPSYDDHECIFGLKYENEDVAINKVKEVAKKFKQIDNRKYFNGYYIALYDCNDNYLGIYDITTFKYINRYEAAVKEMTYHFAGEVNLNSGDLEGITYLYYKRIQYKDVEKLQLEWLDKDNVTENDWTTAYYFKYYDNVYFILDDVVYIENVFNYNIYGKYYTNYWFYE